MTDRQDYLPGDIVEMTKSLDLAERLVGNLLGDVVEKFGPHSVATVDVDAWLALVRKTLSTPRAEIIGGKG